MLSRLRKIDFNYLAKGSFWIGFGQFFATMANIAIFLVLGNYLSKESFGDYRLIISISGIISIFFLNGMNAAVAQAVANGIEGILRPAVRTQIKWSVLPFAVSFIIAAYYFLSGAKTEIAVLIMLIGLIAPLTNSFNTYSFYLNGKRRFREIGISTSAVAAVNLAVIILAVMAGLGTVMIIPLVFASLLVLNYALYKKTAANEGGGDNKKIEHYLDFGKKVSLPNAINILSQYLDNVLIYLHFGAVELAVYSFAKLIPDSLKNATKVINPLAMPKFSRYGKENIPDIRFKTMLLTGALLLAALVYMATPNEMFLLFFPQYGESINLSKIYSLSIIGFSSIIPSTFFNSQKSKKAIFNYNLVTSAFKIISLWVGISFYGLLGAVISSVVSSVFSLGYSLLLMKKAT